MFMNKTKKNSLLGVLLLGADEGSSHEPHDIVFVFHEDSNIKGTNKLSQDIVLSHCSNSFEIVFPGEIHFEVKDVSI
jgi:hypothetical protein